MLIHNLIHDLIHIYKALEKLCFRNVLEHSFIFILFMII
jgi:hypothetical protein